MASPSLTPALLSQYSAICPSPGQPNPSQVESASAPPEAILRFLRSPSAFTQRPSVAPHCPRERVEPGIQGPRKAAPASFPTPCTPLSNLSPDAQAPPRPGSSRSVGPLAWNVCQPRRGWREATGMDANTVEGQSRLPAHGHAPSPLPIGLQDLSPKSQEEYRLSGPFWEMSVLRHTGKPRHSQSIVPGVHVLRQQQAFGAMPQPMRREGH